MPKPNKPKMTPGERRTLADTLSTLPQKPSVHEPLWAGPSDPGPRGGISFSMLSRWFQCRERFRVQYVEGWKPADTFNHKLEYGQMWHAAEEAYAGQFGADVVTTESTEEYKPWNGALREYVKGLSDKYPMDREQIQHWYDVCRTQFPLYVKYWSQHEHVRDRTPLLAEQVFDVPYALPSGRTVRLRGKWDSVDLIGKGTSARIYLMENKTKGDIDITALQRQLSFDLQTMMYTVALTEIRNDRRRDHGIQIENVQQALKATFPFAGIRYNVVRRPLSGGKGSIVRHKPTKSNPAGESRESYYARLGAYITEDPAHYFTRFQVEVTPADVARFRRECLDPALEQLCDWYEQQTTTPMKYGALQGGRFAKTGYVTPLSYRLPYGCSNWLLEGGYGDVDEYMSSGSTVGLVRAEAMFGELT